MNSELELDDYQLSCELHGHSLDVRAVTEGDNCIISGSRDKTVKIWKMDNDGKYYDYLTLTGHTNFISSVYYMEDVKWICTGSNDNKINIYEEGNQTPFEVLKGHTDTVCTISQGLASNQIISGSWDKTARAWDITKSGSKILTEFSGAPAAIWSVVTLSTGNYAAACADKQIYLWNQQGELINTLKGHTDCVRGLAALEDGSLLSCANDATIRLWSLDGKYIREFYGHTNYIYSIDTNKSLGEGIFVTCGEDSSIRMWHIESRKHSKIIVPAQSVWSVHCMKNGDIVVGTSDGIVRIFTKQSNRFANVEALTKFKEEVDIFTFQSNQELGGIKHKDLPGPESLMKEGNEGQTQIVRYPDGKIRCHQWTNGEWILVGDVMGASGGTNSTSGKKLYEGKEYDYVFSVDISDDAPQIKLPYNKGDDPWTTAQEFIHKNQLPQVYLEEVANFIIKNANITTIPTNNTNTGYQDPFTGETRYVPGTNENGKFTTQGNADPFTGNSSYVTNASKIRNKSSGLHFPTKLLITFDNADIEKILAKLKEFNGKRTGADTYIPEEKFDAVMELTKEGASPNESAIETLQIMLKWPKDILFPVLDVTRLAIRNENIFKILNDNYSLFYTLIDCIESKPPNQLMATRCFVNILKHPTGQSIISMNFIQIAEKLLKINRGNANLQLAIATFYLDVSITQLESSDITICANIIEITLEFIKWCLVPETCYRALQAIGNITSTPYSGMASRLTCSYPIVYKKIEDISNKPMDDVQKLGECANDLLVIIDGKKNSE